MNLEEAIKILESKLPNAMPNNPPRHLEATRLGIEALKSLQTIRLSKLAWFSGPLPGED